MDKKILLSIGMIVKNEERNLEKCLNALQFIIDKIPSELIIADTGSTDRTREIASQYTKQLYSFRWCNDFSKARNFVLDKACGKWFMFIDADEWIDNGEQLIEFLQSKASDGFNDIGVIQKNYYTYSGSEYKEDYVKRIFRRLPGRRFQGMVHETVSAQGNIKYLDVILHHYGYVLEEKKFGVSGKSSRNTPLLLKELEKKPEDLGILYQLAQEYAVQDDRARLEQVCEKIVRKFGKKKDNYYVINTYWFLNELYVRRGDYEKIVKSAEPYAADSDGCNLKVIDIIAQALDVLFREKNYEKAGRYYKKFFSIIDECREREQKGESGFSASVLSLREDELEKRYYFYAYVLFKCENYEESFQYLKQIRGILGNDLIEGNTALWYGLLSATGKYDEIIDYYVRIKGETAQGLDYLQRMILYIWREDIDVGQRIALRLPETGAADEFTELLALYVREEKKEPIRESEIRNLLAALPLKQDYYGILILALKRHIPVGGFIGRCANSQIDIFARTVGSLCPEIREVLLNTGTDETDLAGNAPVGQKPAKELLFYSKVKEYLLLDVHLTGPQIKELFNSYIQDMNRYLRFLYRPQLLCAPDCEDLPEEHCFAAYILLAFKSIEEGDTKNGLSCYGRALRIRPAFKSVIKLLTDDVQKKQEEEEEARKQFQAYGSKIKQIIDSLILSGNNDAAREALTAYEKINPRDSDIEKLREKLGSRFSGAAPSSPA